MSVIISSNYKKHYENIRSQIEGEKNKYTSLFDRNNIRYFPSENSHFLQNNDLLEKGYYLNKIYL